MEEKMDTYPVRPRQVTSRPEAPLRARIEDLESRVKELEQALIAIGNRDAADVQHLAVVIGTDLPSQMPQGAGGFR